MGLIFRVTVKAIEVSAEIIMVRIRVRD